MQTTSDGHISMSARKFISTLEAAALPQIRAKTAGEKPELFSMVRSLMGAHILENIRHYEQLASGEISVEWEPISRNDFIAFMARVDEGILRKQIDKGELSPLELKSRRAAMAQDVLARLDTVAASLGYQIV